MKYIVSNDSILVMKISGKFSFRSQHFASGRNEENLRFSGSQKQIRCKIAVDMTQSLKTILGSLVLAFFARMRLFGQLSFTVPRVAFALDSLQWICTLSLEILKILEFSSFHCQGKLYSHLRDKWLLSNKEEPFFCVNERRRFSTKKSSVRDNFPPFFQAREIASFLTSKLYYKTFFFNFLFD